MGKPEGEETKKETEEIPETMTAFPQWLISSNEYQTIKHRTRKHREH